MSMREDHLNGCEGRTYTCTCGYDNEKDNEIARLRQELQDQIIACEIAMDELRRLRAASPIRSE